MLSFISDGLGTMSSIADVEVKDSAAPQIATRWSISWTLLIVMKLCSLDNQRFVSLFAIVKKIKVDSNI